MVVVILIAGGASVFLFTWSLFRMHQEVTGATQLDIMRRQKITSPLFQALISFGRPFALIVRYYALKLEARYEDTGHKPMPLTLRDRIERNLLAAGSPHGMTADEYFGVVILCGLIGGFVGIISAAAAHWTLLIVGGLVCGLLWPITWLQAQVARRKTQIFRSLPFALDLLTLSVEAGLDFTSALSRIVEKIRETPLGVEFSELLRQIQMGQSRATALRQLAWRVNLEELTNVAGAMIQADELGSSIGPILRIQAEQMRVRREQLAEKRAMEAPVKILLPLILFIFPTVFIIILGPVALKILQDWGKLP